MDGRGPEADLGCEYRLCHFCRGALTLFRGDTAASLTCLDSHDCLEKRALNARCLVTLDMPSRFNFPIVHVVMSWPELA